MSPMKPGLVKPTTPAERRMLKRVKLERALVVSTAVRDAASEIAIAGAPPAIQAVLRQAMALAETDVAQARDACDPADARRVLAAHTRNEKE